MPRAPEIAPRSPDRDPLAAERQRVAEVIEFHRGDLPAAAAFEAQSLVEAWVDAAGPERRLAVLAAVERTVREMISRYSREPVERPSFPSRRRAR